MFCIEKLKLNRYVCVSIPRNKDLFNRVGPRSSSVPSEGSDDVIPMSNRTLDQLEYMDKYDSYMQRLENSERESQSRNFSENEASEDSN